MEKIQVRNIHKTRHIVSEIVHNLLSDKIYLFVLAAIFVKSMMFVGLLGTDKLIGINFHKGFFSVPPFLIFLAFAAAVLSISFLFEARSHLWALIILDLIVTILIVGDIWYYRAFAQFLNFFLFAQTANLNNLGSSITSMMRPIDVLFFADIIFLTIYTICNNGLYKGLPRNVILFFITLILPVTYLTYVHFKVDVAKRCFHGQYAFRQSWSPIQTMSDLGPIGYHVYDGYRYYVNSKAYILSAQEKKDINNWYDKNAENLPNNKYAGMFKGKNLIVIQWESLENFVVNQKFEGQEITPNVNKILKNSIYFDNYHENILNGTSSDADLMTNTGVYPVRDGATFFRYPDNKYKHSLPNLMQSMGYLTYAIHPDKASYWNWMPALQSIGFQKCFDSTCYVSKHPIGLGIADQEFLEQVAPIMEKEKQPFYDFVVTLTSHAPFDLPKQYRSMNLDSKFDSNILGGYFQSIHYTDEYIGEFLNNLDKAGILKNSVVVIYGDHTSVHKFYSDKVSEVRPQEDWWMHNDMRIPLIIYNPSLSQETIHTQCAQIDLLPTIAYIMGVNKDEYQKNALGKVALNTDKNYTMLENFKMFGKHTKEEEDHMRQGIMLSNKMVQSDYFKDK